MNYTYRCKHLDLGEGVYSKEPIIPVTLGTENKLTFTAILDSGSDFVLIPLEVAEALNLKINKRKKQAAKVYTGEKISTTESKVKITITKSRQQPVSFICKCMVLLNADQQHEHIIFGSSFFNHFKIIFDYPNNKFQIKK